MIYKMAVVEDEPAAAAELKSMIERFNSENISSDEFAVSMFSDANSFLKNYESYDVIFLDIQMTGMNGMDAAREIRKQNEEVLIVFVTNMAQYAVESYEVQAYDFILKPLSYGNFFMKFRRILKMIAHKSSDAYITLSTRFESHKVKILNIVYIESCNHNIIVHLTGGQEIRVTGSTLSSWEKKLSNYHFVRCNSGFLVNLKYAEVMRGDYVVAEGVNLHISRSRKQYFMTEFAKYVGGSV